MLDCDADDFVHFWSWVFFCDFESSADGCVHYRDMLDCSESTAVGFVHYCDLEVARGRPVLLLQVWKLRADSFTSLRFLVSATQCQDVI
jgi:hypothetical protein